MPRENGDLDNFFGHNQETHLKKTVEDDPNIQGTQPEVYRGDIPLLSSLDDGE